MPEVVIRLVKEAIAARMRHRALIAELERLGLVNFDNYAQEYVRICNRDAKALFAEIMLNREDFIALFEPWERDDTKRYRVPNPTKKRRKSSR
jgi:hypothetical protein